jgi:NADH:ubiquinone oxidoreductase subunit K
MTDKFEVKIPIWFWATAGAALLWNCVGLWDFYNSATLNEKYLSAFPGYLEFIRDMPMWAKGAWGVAVLTSVIGTLGLLLRKTWAVPVFALSIIAMIIAFVYQFTASNKPEGTTATLIMTVIVWVIAFFLYGLSRRARSRKWLT